MCVIVTEKASAAASPTALRPVKIMRLRFGPYELDSERFELRYEDAVVSVEPRPLELLFLLAERAPDVVPAATIRERLWPEVAVGRDAFFQCVRKARMAVRDRRTRGGVVETVRGEGLRLGLAVERHHGAPGSERGTPWCGAEALIATAEETLQATVHGTFRCLLVSGPAGSGKTRALAELPRRLGLDDAIVVHVPLLESDSRSTLAPWLEVVAALRKQVEPTVLARLPDTLLDGLDAMEPDEIGDTAALEEGRARVFQGFGQLLRRVAQTSTLVLCLDDLHWCDVQSISMLVALVDRLDDARVLVVATYRAGELGPEHPLWTVFDDFARRGLSRVHRLEPIRPRDVHRIAAEHGWGRVDPRVVERLCESSGGNPLVIDRLCAHLWPDRGEPGIGTRELLARLEEVPPSLEPIFHEQLRSLGADARALLAMAAVAGPTSDFMLVAKATGIEPAASARAIDECTRVHALVPNPGTASRFEFTQESLRRFVLGLESSAQRADHHARLAMVLLAEDRPRTSTTEQLLRHLGAARDPALVGPATEWALGLADRAVDTPHIDETVAACHSVLGLMARAGRGNTPDRPRLEAVIERDHGAREREVPAEHAIADQAGASLAGR